MDQDWLKGRLWATEKKAPKRGEAQSSPWGTLARIQALGISFPSVSLWLPALAFESNRGHSCCQLFTATISPSLPNRIVAATLEAHSRFPSRPDPLRQPTVRWQYHRALYPSDAECSSDFVPETKNICSLTNHVLKNTYSNKY